MTGTTAAGHAAARLTHAYHHRDPAAPQGARVGIFGNGLPETLVAAQGALAVHLADGRAAEGGHPVCAIIEPFVDHEVRQFLIRLMRGDFAGLRAILFARDDAPALIAYQYATEWLRQDRPHGGVPPLFLWNLVHTDSAPVARFNAVQAQKLQDLLVACGLPPRSDDSLAAAAKDEDRRLAALARMAALRGCGLDGTTAHIWRNAGRALPAADHAALLEAALADLPAVTPPARRIAVVGSPLGDLATYRMIEGFGTITADLHPLGDDWPAAANRATGLAALLHSAATDPACPRTTPANRQFDHLVHSVLAAGCDLVVAQLAQTDDTFGWEIPRLFQTLRGHGVTCVTLGFRDPAPDTAWLDASAALIARALEAAP